mmetsp:Transcript_38868/g.88305  ORF Transcript_38868/g.88305 Transcript_38868/m.88305 type:complete len:258 (-) Transcript_38868:1808-2581(-)
MATLATIGRQIGQDTSHTATHLFAAAFNNILRPLMSPNTAAWSRKECAPRATCAVVILAPTCSRHLCRAWKQGHNRFPSKESTLAPHSPFRPAATHDHPQRPPPPLPPTWSSSGLSSAWSIPLSSAFPSMMPTSPFASGSLWRACTRPSKARRSVAHCVADALLLTSERHMTTPTAESAVTKSEPAACIALINWSTSSNNSACNPSNPSIFCVIRCLGGTFWFCQSLDTSWVSCNPSRGASPTRRIASSSSLSSRSS